MKACESERFACETPKRTKRSGRSESSFESRRQHGRIVFILTKTHRGDESSCCSNAPVAALVQPSRGPPATPPPMSRSGRRPRSESTAPLPRCPPNGQHQLLPRAYLMPWTRRNHHRSSHGWARCFVLCVRQSTAPPRPAPPRLAGGSAARARHFSSFFIYQNYHFIFL